MGQIDLKDFAHPTTSPASAPQPVSRIVESHRLTQPPQRAVLQHRRRITRQNEYEYKRMLAHGITAYPNGFEIVLRQKPFPSVTSKSSRTHHRPQHRLTPCASRAGTGGTQRHSPHSPPPERGSLPRVLARNDHRRAVTAIRDPDLPPSDISHRESKTNGGTPQPTPRTGLRQRPHPPLHPRRKPPAQGRPSPPSTTSSAYANLNGPTVVVDPKAAIKRELPAVSPSHLFRQP